MTPDRYETPPGGPRRLAGRTGRRGSQTGFPTLGAIAFGGAFVVAGIAIMLVGIRGIPVDPKSVHAPYWTLTAMGTVFAICGFWVWGMAARQHASNRRREDALLRYAGEAALADYAWDPQGSASKRWNTAARALAGAGLMTLFISILNWWAFFTESPWPVKVVTGLFDLVLVVVWWQTVVLVGRALKFGASRVRFFRFPFRVGEPMDIAWQPASGIGRANCGSFTLRCVREWFEVAAAVRTGTAGWCTRSSGAAPGYSITPTSSTPAARSICAIARRSPSRAPTSPPTGRSSGNSRSGSTCRASTSRRSISSGCTGHADAARAQRQPPINRHSTAASARRQCNRGDSRSGLRAMPVRGSERSAAPSTHWHRGSTAGVRRHAGAAAGRASA
jgi:hypothetical protein